MTEIEKKDFVKRLFLGNFSILQKFMKIINIEWMKDSFYCFFIAIVFENNEY